MPEENEVRSFDQQYEVTWTGGIPALAIGASVQRGQVRTVSKRWTLGGTETFNFDSSEVKGPVQEAVLGAGWTWRGVMSGTL
ncbi:hypothetical protein ACWEV4_02235 [Streptomyces sp. NPDC003860]